MLGMRKKSRAILEHLISGSGDSFVSPYQVAMVHARLGDIPATLDWLDRAGAQRDANFVCAPVDPAFEALRETAVWRDLMKKHGLSHSVAANTPAENPASAVTPPSRSSPGSVAYRRRYHA